MKLSEPHMPTRIRIGYLDFKIEDWEPLKAADAQRYGECSHADLTIRVCLRHGTRKAANTLLHEILHAIWWVANLEDEDKEERTVCTIANALSAAWRDSPDVFAWIEHHLRHGSNE